MAAAAGFNRRVFFDDFTSWSTFDLTGTGTIDANWYLDRPNSWGQTTPDELALKDGVLTITPKTTQPNYQIGTASPKGGRGKSFRYGYIEARLAFDPRNAPASSGWPSFWAISRGVMLNKDMGGRSAELDIFEAYPNDDKTFGDFFVGTLHDWRWPTAHYFSWGNNSVKRSGVDWTQFHDYAVLWEPGRVVWYLDGVKQLEQRFSATAAPVPNTNNLPVGTFSNFDSETEGQGLILGTGIGYPLQVDSVSVFQR